MNRGGGLWYGGQEGFRGRVGQRGLLATAKCRICSTVRYSTEEYSTKNGAVESGSVQCITVQCSTLRAVVIGFYNFNFNFNFNCTDHSECCVCSTWQHSTVQSSTVRYCTVYSSRSVPIPVCALRSVLCVVYVQSYVLLLFQDKVQDPIRTRDARTAYSPLFEHCLAQYRFKIKRLKPVPVSLVEFVLKLHPVET